MPVFDLDSDSKEPIETQEPTKDELADLLKDDEEEPEESKIETKPEPETDKDESEEEKEEELEIKDEDKEELKEEDIEPEFTVKRKEILSKYPKVFKEFPQLERALYSNYQYREILPTIEDAKEAVGKAEMLDEFQGDLLKGNIEKTLSSIKQADNKAFNKIIDNYLPTLHQVDERAYYHVVGNVLKVAVRDMFKEGETSKNEALQNAAHILHQYMFGTSQFTPPTKLSKETSEQGDEERKQLESEREQFVRERFEAAREDIDYKVTNTLKSAINDYIDPKNAMTGYVKKHAVNEALENLTSIIASDRAFKSQLDRLWEKAFENNFSNDAKTKIRAAYISKAKTLLKDVITKSRNEALKGMNRTSREDNTDRKGPITPGKSTADRSGKIKNAKEIPKGMSSYEFLSQD